MEYKLAIGIEQSSLVVAIARGRGTANVDMTLELDRGGTAVWSAVVGVGDRLGHFSQSLVCKAFSGVGKE